MSKRKKRKENLVVWSQCGWSYLAVECVCKKKSPKSFGPTLNQSCDQCWIHHTVRVGQQHFLPLPPSLQMPASNPMGCNTHENDHWARDVFVSWAPGKFLFFFFSLFLFFFCSTNIFFNTIRLHLHELIWGKQWTVKMAETTTARRMNAHHWWWARDREGTTRAAEAQKCCMFHFFSFTYFVFTKCFRITAKMSNHHHHYPSQSPESTQARDTCMSQVFLVCYLFLFFFGITK